MRVNGIYRSRISNERFVVYGDQLVPLDQFLSDTRVSEESKGAAIEIISHKTTPPAQPISTPMYRILYLVNGKERRSPWLYHEKNAQRGLALMREKYGDKNAIIYVC